MATHRNISAPDGFWRGDTLIEDYLIYAASGRNTFFSLIWTAPSNAIRESALDARLTNDRLRANLAYWRIAFDPPPPPAYTGTREDYLNELLQIYCEGRKNHGEALRAMLEHHRRLIPAAPVVAQSPPIPEASAPVAHPPPHTPTPPPTTTHYGITAAPDLFVNGLPGFEAIAGRIPPPGPGDRDPGARVMANFTETDVNITLSRYSPELFAAVYNNAFRRDGGTHRTAVEAVLRFQMALHATPAPVEDAHARAAHLEAHLNGRSRRTTYSWLYDPPNGERRLNLTRLARHFSEFYSGNLPAELHVLNDAGIQFSEAGQRAYLLTRLGHAGPPTAQALVTALQAADVASGGEILVGIGFLPPPSNAAPPPPPDVAAADVVRSGPAGKADPGPPRVEPSAPHVAQEPPPSPASPPTPAPPAPPPRIPAATPTAREPATPPPAGWQATVQPARNAHPTARALHLLLTNPQMAVVPIVACPNRICATLMSTPLSSSRVA